MTIISHPSNLCPNLRPSANSGVACAPVGILSQQEHNRGEQALMSSPEAHSPNGSGTCRAMRWTPTVGQFGGLAKLGSGCRQAANFSILVAQYASSGVRPASGCVHEFWPTCADEFWPTLRGSIC